MPKSFFTLMACEIIIEVCYKMFAADVAALIASAFNNNNERFLDTKQRRKLCQRKSQVVGAVHFVCFFPKFVGTYIDRIAMNLTSGRKFLFLTRKDRFYSPRSV